jgi:hypothetical protein
MLPGGVTESACAVLTSAHNNKMNMTGIMTRSGGCQTMFSFHNPHSMPVYTQNVIYTGFAGHVASELDVDMLVILYTPFLPISKLWVALQIPAIYS